MIVVPLRHLEHGKIIGDDILREDGQTIIHKGTRIQGKVMEILKANSVNFVSVLSSPDEDTSIKAVKPIEERPLKNIREKIYQVMESAAKNRGLDFEILESLSDNVAAVVETIVEFGAMVDKLDGINKFDSYTFDHSVEVMMDSLILAEQLYKDKVLPTLSYQDRITLAFGALFHDIGKLTIDPDIIKKTGRLTEEEFKEIKNHSKRGLLALRMVRPFLEGRFSSGNKKNVDAKTRMHELGVETEHESGRKMDIDFDVVEQIVTEHHQRPDGKGYGLGKVPIDQLSPLVWIVGYADAYDAMATDRSYQVGKHPTKILEIIEQEQGKQFFPDYFESFKKVVVPYPRNSIVFLDDGSIGVVTKYNKAHTHYTCRVMGSLDKTGISELGEEKSFSLDRIVAGAKYIIPETSHYVGDRDQAENTSLDNISTAIKQALTADEPSDATIRLLSLLRENGGTEIYADLSWEEFVSEGLDREGIWNVIHKILDQDKDRMLYSEIGQAIRSRISDLRDRVTDDIDYYTEFAPSI